MKIHHSYILPQETQLRDCLAQHSRIYSCVGVEPMLQNGCFQQSATHSISTNTWSWEIQNSSNGGFSFRTYHHLAEMFLELHWSHLIPLNFPPLSLFSWCSGLHHDQKVLFTPLGSLPSFLKTHQPPPRPKSLVYLTFSCYLLFFGLELTHTSLVSPYLFSPSQDILMISSILYYILKVEWPKGHFRSYTLHNLYLLPKWSHLDPWL